MIHKNKYFLLAFGYMVVIAVLGLGLVGKSPSGFDVYTVGDVCWLLLHFLVVFMLGVFGGIEYQERKGDL